MYGQVKRHVDLEVLVGAWDDFEESAKSKIQKCGTQCTIGKLLTEVDDDARKAITRALENPALSSSSIYRALRDRLPDFKVSEGTLSRHRRKNCRCEEVSR